MKTRAGKMVEIGKMDCVEAEVEPIRDGEVLVRGHYGSICGSDLHVVYDGVMTAPSLWIPGYPGHEGVGEVLESRSPDHSPGDQVLLVPNAAIGQCFSEIQRVAADSAIRLEGDDLPPLDQVLMAQQLGTVIFAMRQHPVDVAGQTVVVLGQGSAGLFWSYLLKRAGAARVIVADLSASRLSASPGFGADVMLHPPADDVEAAVSDLTGGEGADFVVEAVGRPDTFLQSPKLARMGGTLFWFGLPDTANPINVDFQTLFRKKLTCYTTYGAQEEPGRVSFRMAVELIRRGEIDVKPLVSHVLPVEQIDEAFRMAQDRPDGTLKVSVSF